MATDTDEQQNGDGSSGASEQRERDPHDTPKDLRGGEANASGEAPCGGKTQGPGVHLGPDRDDRDPSGFSGFILSLAHAAMIEMGIAHAPDGTAVEKNLEMAQQTIDIIHMLKRKTSGNLSAEECRLLDGVLYQLHLCYVESSSSKR